MSDDALARAARALRDAHDGRSDAARTTRVALLAAAADRRRRRSKVVAVLVPLAAVLALSTAWAAVTGRLPRSLEGLLHRSPPVTGAAPAGPPPALEPPALSVPPASPELPEFRATSVPAPAPVPTVAPDIPVTPALPPVSSRAWRPAPAASSKADDALAEESLFDAAHRAHFVAHDPAAALRAWDAYLAAYPRGRFALEASYNRALTLVRLGRIDEAREALRPFARGSLGGYRQREATGLLEALDAGP